MKKSAKVQWLKRVIKEQNPEIQGVLWYQVLDLTKETSK